MPCDCCDQPGEYVLSITPPDYRDKYQHITASPAEFLRNLQSRLHTDLDSLTVLHKDHYALWTLNEFLFSLTDHPKQEFEEHKHGLETFIEEGLLDTLTKFMCSDGFWTYTTSMIPTGISHRWLQMFSWILYDICYLLTYPTTFKNLNISAKSLVAVQSYSITFQEDLTNLLSKMWQYRRDLVRVTPEDGSIVYDSPLNQPVADSAVSLLLFLQLRDGNLAKPRFSPEAGPLMLWCWAKTEYAVDNNVVRTLSVWLNDVDGTGKHIPAIGLPLLLADHDATKDVVSICSWYLNIHIVGLPLVDVIVIAGQVIARSDQSTFDAVRHLCPELVGRLARACERQLCSGPEVYHRMVLSHAISSMFKPFCANSARLFVRPYDIGHLDLISLLAQHSAYAVQHSPGDVESIVELLVSYAIGLFHVPDVRCYKALTSDATRKRITDAIVAVNQVSATSLVVKLCKKKMLEAWKNYESRLGALSPPSNGSDVSLGKTCAYKTCLCSTRRRPAHKLHVCKGCWQVYYCNPECQKADWFDGHSSRCKVLRG